MKIFTGAGEESSRQGTSLPLQTTDVSMASPTTSLARTNLSLKRSGPSNLQAKGPAKKHRGEQDTGSREVASKIDWMASLTVPMAGAKPTTASTSPQDPCVFIHVGSSCMYSTMPSLRIGEVLTLSKDAGLKSK